MHAGYLFPFITLRNGQILKKSYQRGASLANPNSDIPSMYLLTNNREIPQIYFCDSLTTQTDT